MGHPLRVELAILDFSWSWIASAATGVNQLFVSVWCERDSRAVRIREGASLWRGSTWWDDLTLSLAFLLCVDFFPKRSFGDGVLKAFGAKCGKSREASIDLGCLGAKARWIWPIVSVTHWTQRGVEAMAMPDCCCGAVVVVATEGDN